MLKEANRYYLTAWPDVEAMQRIFKRLCNESGVETEIMPEGLRTRSTESHRFVFNYNAHDVEFKGELIPAADVQWKIKT